MKNGERGSVLVYTVILVTVAVFLALGFLGSREEWLRGENRRLLRTFSELDSEIGLNNLSAFIQNQIATSLSFDPGTLTGANGPLASAAQSSLAFNGVPITLYNYTTNIAPTAVINLSPLTFPTDQLQSLTYPATSLFDPLYGASALSSAFTITQAARTVSNTESEYSNRQRVTTVEIRQVPLSVFTVFSNASTLISPVNFPNGTGRVHIEGLGTISGNVTAIYPFTVTGGLSFSSGATLTAQRLPSDSGSAHTADANSTVNDFKGAFENVIVDQDVNHSHVVIVPDLVGKISTQCQIAIVQPQFVYVANEGGTVSAYSMGSNGALALNVPGSPFVAGSVPKSVAIDPTGKFAYVANGDGTVSAYTIDPSTGALTAITGSPFTAGNLPVSVAVDPTGKFAYVANGGGTVSAYTIDPSTGALTAITGSPFTAGSTPVSVAVAPTGKFAYVANGGGTVSAYTIDLSTGALTAITGSPFTAGSTPVSVAVDPTAKFAYVANGGGTVSAYTIDPRTGALTAITGSPFTAGSTPVSVAVDPTGKFAYVANGGGTVSAYTIDPRTGALTAITGSPFTVGSTPASLAVDSTGKFAYVANAGGSNLSAYSIDPTTGALTALAPIGTFTAGILPASVAIAQDSFSVVPQNGMSQATAALISSKLSVDRTSWLSKRFPATHIIQFDFNYFRGLIDSQSGAPVVSYYVTSVDKTAVLLVKNAGVLGQNLSIVSDLAVWVSNGFNDGTVTSGTEQDVIYGTQSGYNPSLYNASIVTSQKLVGVNTGP